MQLRSMRWQTWMARQARPRLRASEPPLRAELFSVEQLTLHAKALAAEHRILFRRRSNVLLSRLDDNEARLRDFNRASVAVESKRQITPAAEWLLDNAYLVEEQIQTARRHLPRNYSRELPSLAHGHSAGWPRVYDIVLELISHVDAQVDAGSLSAFIDAYQTAGPLRLGELWAVPIMLRLGLIENLRRITTRLALARLDRDLADTWVERLQDMAETHPSNLVLVVADMAESDPPLTSSFVAEFCQRLSRQTPVLHLARGWLEQRLVAQGLSMEQLIHQEGQNQAADQVSVSHTIASLRFLTAMNWKEFVEALSVVEHTLRTDPAGVYGRMDFPTRDTYRHAVEALARHSGREEIEVAQEAVALAAAAAREKGPADRAAHVGCALIDEGRPELERRLAVRWPWPARIERAIRQRPLLFFVGGVCLLTALGTLGWVHAVRWFDGHGWTLALSALLFAVGASQLAVALMNWLSMLLVQPSLLPRLESAGGLTADQRTMVVVPTMITRFDGIDRLVETLEIHYLANRDPHLHFALLTDFADATHEREPEDEALLARVRGGIEQLNLRHPSAHHGRFLLLHRPRRWNAGERRWMGYERKRGKLAAFNALLRGGSRDAFSAIVGDTAVLPQIKYVITLDTDTQLPRDAARTLVATMAHPLNRPVFDPTRGVVVAGYGILQPRVGVSLPGAGRSWFVRLFAGDAGIDPYTRAVSDVYQDLFAEGSFIGKGIYEVDAFERALTGRLPENAVLSHDLLEACHARSGLVSDVELFEEHPARYDVDLNRRHRWIRGDWQIAPWLWSRVPGAGRRRPANPLSVLSQWKILDNLRRSLVPPALLLLLAGTWLLGPEIAGLGSLAVLALVIVPALLPALVGGVRKPADLPWAMHLRGAAGTCGRQAGQVALSLVFLPYEAFVSADAIVRTALRMLVTHRRLLEWRTSSEVERGARSGLGGFYRQMWSAPAVAVGVAWLLWRNPAETLVPALPFLVAWCAAPAVAWWISRPIAVPEPDLTAAQRAFLGRSARRTWHFFETFVTAEENWLPPDNFQEAPGPTIASRTSPTNIGLALLANLAARDFGYLSVGGLVQRTRDTLATLHRLERHRGHFYNWYDTRTLQPLPPHYLSSVDSGNLAGHLLTLGAGLRELARERIFGPHVCRGLRDTVGVLQGVAGESAALAQIDAALAEPPATLSGALALLETVHAHAARFVANLGERAGETRRWAVVLERTCAGQRDELRELAPWLMAGAEDRSEPMAGGTLAAQWEAVPTLQALAELEALPGPAAARWREAAGVARERIVALEELARQCEEFAQMDFRFLFDPARELFSIGYNVTDRRRDPGYYDLLASESRLGSYVAIAQGQVPQDHWFSLGRLLVAVQGDPVLLSWSGSMFEYLMPLLVMPNYPNTLLAHTCEAAVRQQINYGEACGIPWGISESGYNRTDAHLNYQYRAFGVPGLGLKRGLADDRVIAPYATVLALMVAPRAACENLQRLAAEGREGSCGFYEAIDYTPARQRPNEASALLRSFMAHHQGMSLLAFAYLLCGRPMQRRFLACPVLRAADLLLQERVPRAAASVFAGDLELVESGQGSPDDRDGMRVFTQPGARIPDVHLLSNGRYHLVITSAGGGYSRWHDLALTRWREDATRDCWGTFIYLRDPATGEFWSASAQPVPRAAKGGEAIFTAARAEFRQRHAGLEVHTGICVSPEDDVELRRITLTNQGSSPRVIEVTSYAEVVLAAAAADAAHPAFSNLFVQTEFVRQPAALLCTRRARSRDEKPPWLLHLLVGPGGGTGETSGETDRARFVGRGGTLARPAALTQDGPLSNTAGAVLDPIVALRRTVTVPPHESAVIDLVIGVTGSRVHALALAEKYQQSRMGDRAFELAWTHSQVTLRQINATEAEAQLYGRLAGALIHADPDRRAAPGLLRGNRRGQSGLWSYGISGDAPIVLLHCSEPARIGIVRQLIQAHAYWRTKGLVSELVIVSEDVAVYRQSLQEEIIGLIASGTEAQWLEKPGGIFVRRHEQIPPEDRGLLQAAARIVLSDQNGTLAEQWQQRSTAEVPMPLLVPSRSALREAPRPLPPRELIFVNGFGGFTRDGHEYVITLQARQMTPAPWVNVLANPWFGTVVSESGGAYTWLENAHEFRLTPWSNDPVRDTSGEAFYLRDEQTGQFWS
ncbi:MAG: hypothetical protein JNL92_00550, partial [Opitutaceae bacterium]|nr:hypothetical protein [Opitutaceae bacterium]